MSDPLNPDLDEFKAVPDEELDVELLNETMTQHLAGRSEFLQISEPSITAEDTEKIEIQTSDELSYTFRADNVHFRSYGLGIYKLAPDVPDVEYGTDAAACFDLRAYFHHQTVTLYDPANNKVIVEGYEKVRLQAGWRMLVPTGMILDILPGYSVRLHPRSGLAVKFGITLANAEGVIDSDYTNQLYVPLLNTTGIEYNIMHGDRIAQAEFVQQIRPEIEYITEAPGQKGNRTGGFGSTGHK